MLRALPRPFSTYQMSSLQEPRQEGFKIPIMLMKIKAQKDEIKRPQCGKINVQV